MQLALTRLPRLGKANDTAPTVEPTAPADDPQIEAYMRQATTARERAEQILRSLAEPKPTVTRPA
jgi:hypothetical protein